MKPGYLLYFLGVDVIMGELLNSTNHITFYDYIKHLLFFSPQNSIIEYDKPS